MPFPISRTITLAIDASYKQDDVLDEIERGLPSLGANALRRASRTVSFRVPWTTSYGPLFMVTSGDFAIQHRGGSARSQSLCCHLSFRRAAVTVMVLVYGWLGVGASLLEGGYTGGSLVGTFVFCTIGWCLLLGVWYLIVPFWLVRRLKLRRLEQAAGPPAA